MTPTTEPLRHDPKRLYPNCPGQHGQGVADASAAQLFILQLVSFAVDYPAPDVVDFMQIAARYQEKMRREDDELLLLALVI